MELPCPVWLIVVRVSVEPGAVLTHPKYENALLATGLLPVLNWRR